MARVGPSSYRASTDRPVVDLRSDTITRPTRDMRRAMASAEVGDDVYGDDPTVNRLQDVAAELLGKEAALFVPSGTMANQIALRCHTRPGERVLLEALAHIRLYEAAAPAVISGCMTEPIPAVGGILDPADVEAAIPPDDPHMAAPSVLCVEDTSNRGGGTVYPLERLDALAAVARAHELKLHLDGARLFNAVVASGVSAAERCAHFDTVSFCLSKGLGAPVGSLLVGTSATIHRARRVRKMLGGGMRQAGIIAAGGLYALEHHVDRLAEDHARARRLWEALVDQGWEAEEPQTNMVYLTAPGAHEIVAGLVERGILCVPLADDRIRLVTHLDVDDTGIDRSLAAFAEVRASA